MAELVIVSRIHTSSRQKRLGARFDPCCTKIERNPASERCNLNENDRKQAAGT